MTQEEQTALVDGQQAAAAAGDAKTKAEEQLADAKQVTEEAGKDAAANPEANKAAGQAQEGQTQMRALFKQIIRMRSVRKLSPAAQAAKAAKTAARAAANAAQAAEVAARAADSAAKAAQLAAEYALEENAKAEEKRNAAAAEKQQPVDAAESDAKTESADAAKPQEEVAAK